MASPQHAAPGVRKRGNPFVPPSGAGEGIGREINNGQDRVIIASPDNSDGDDETAEEAKRNGSRLLRARSSAFRVYDTSKEQRAAATEHDYIIRAATAGSLHSSRAMHQSGQFGTRGSLGSTLPSAGGDQFRRQSSRRSTGSSIQRGPDGRPDMLQLLDRDDTLRLAAFRIFDAYASMRCQMLMAVESAKENSIGDNFFLDGCYETRLAIVDNIVFRTWSRAARLRAKTLEHALEAKEFVYEWYVQELERLAALVKMARKLRGELNTSRSQATTMLAEKTLCTVLDELRSTFDMTKQASLELQYRWEDIAAELREEVEMLTGIMVLAEKQAAYGLSAELDDFAKNVEIQVTQKLEEAENVHVKVHKMRKQARMYISSDYTVVWKNTLILSEAAKAKRRKAIRDERRLKEAEEAAKNPEPQEHTSLSNRDFPERGTQRSSITQPSARRSTSQADGKKEEDPHSADPNLPPAWMDPAVQEARERYVAGLRGTPKPQNPARNSRLASTPVIVENDSEDDDFSYTYEYDVVDTDSSGLQSSNDQDVRNGRDESGGEETVPLQPRSRSRQQQ